MDRRREPCRRTRRAQEFGLKLGGEIIHEAGTTRMGTSRSTSVLNEWCQAHDCTFVAEWKGPPAEVLARLGLTEK